LNIGHGETSQVLGAPRTMSEVSRPKIEKKGWVCVPTPIPCLDYMFPDDLLSVVVFDFLDPPSLICVRLVDRFDGQLAKQYREQLAYALMLARRGHSFL